MNNLAALPVEHNTYKACEHRRRELSLKLATSSECVAIVFHRIGPYHKVRIEAAAAKVNVAAVELSAFSSVYSWDKVAVSSSIPRVTICDDVDSRSMRRDALDEKISNTLEQIQPSAVALAGWSDNGALAVLSWCTRNKVPAILMSESNEHDFKRSFLGEWFKRRLMQHFSSAVVGGSLAARYAEKLGMNSRRIHVGYDVVDNHHFSVVSDADRDSWRAKHGIDRPFFLISSRLVSKKNIATAIEAYHLYRLRAEAANQSGECPSEIWDLVIAGDGPLLSPLEQISNALSVKEHVRFVGFLQYDEIPLVYHSCGALLHVSTQEQWGLVVNEAMAAGLPVIVSSSCGCSADLIDHGRSGLLVDPFDKHSIESAMYEVASSKRLRDSLSAAAKKTIACWSPERFASAIEDAFQSAYETPARPGVISRICLSLLRVLRGRS